MHPVSQLINALDGICMGDVYFTESVENGVLFSVVLLGIGNIVVGKAVFLRNFENIEKSVCKGYGHKIDLRIQSKKHN
jgi:hypothetical protein